MNNVSRDIIEHNILYLISLKRPHIFSEYTLYISLEIKASYSYSMEISIALHIPIASLNMTTAYF